MDGRKPWLRLPRDHDLFRQRHGLRTLAVKLQDLAAEAQNYRALEPDDPRPMQQLQLLRDRWRKPGRLVQRPVAAPGWFPSRGRRLPKRPVSVDAEPWPGRVLRGRGNADRATAYWMPIPPGLTPHSLRHCHKTLMTELRTPEISSHERLGHMLPSIGGIYSHVTPAMRQELMDGLTERWIGGLDAGLGMNRRSPVAILDNLRHEHHKNAGERSDGLDVMRMSADSKSRLTAKRPQLTGARFAQFGEDR